LSGQTLLEDPMDRRDFLMSGAIAAAGLAAAPPALAAAAQGRAGKTVDRRAIARPGPGCSAIPT
jgi:hypothetical protein